MAEDGSGSEGGGSEREKTLAEWKECESTEAFKRWPQRPHFNAPGFLQIPLVVRERFALALFQSFLDVVEELENQGKDIPRSRLDKQKEGLVALEMSYGFDSRGPLSKIEEILSVKDKEADLLEEQHGDKSSEEPETVNTTTLVRRGKKQSKKQGKKQL
ncbi:hypothetical protein EUTSA_v10016065mg [Eutrema salsugineum]|uniref:Uncharacterized protein n=1 Tax=Eutrema salsugineum TaxID=72664 RepID=V4LLC3_EUTSA|nr:hypothetical protein EUTSA_v10016065mg [Eutrema salsugineum]